MSQENSYSEILLAGAFAAFTIDLLVYPLDTIKTRLQSRDYIKTYAPATPPAPVAASGSAASVTAAALRHTRSPYALRGLYQGVGSVVIATLPACAFPSFLASLVSSFILINNSAAVFFSTYESAKHVLSTALPGVLDTKAPPSVVVHSLSSGIAELASCIVFTPAEVIKQNAQMIQKAATHTSSKTAAIKPSMSSSLHALQMLRNAEGGAARRLWSGYTALAARNLPFTALQFPMFEAMRVRLLARWGGNNTSNAPTDSTDHLLLIGAVNALSAGSSGALAAVVTTPTDVVKTRMMLSAGASAPGLESHHEQGAGASPAAARSTAGSGAGGAAKAVAAKEAGPRHMNGVQLARLIYREHGVQGLFRGGALRAAWTFVGSGLYLGTYEMVKAWLRNRREAKIVL